MRPTFAVLLALLTLSACAPSNSSGAPPPTAAPTSDQPSAGPAEATASLSPAAKTLAECEGEPQPSGPRVKLAITATEGLFDTKRLEGARDCEAFTVTFHNMDAREPHNFAISLQGHVFSQLFRSEPFYGPGDEHYEIPPLPAGEYHFNCPVHQFMQGALVVSAP